MERMGLVSRVAEDLERVISEGRLPRDGTLPSEQLLSRQYGVSRTTVREALRHLASRGLIVQHPGRRSRVVPLDETVTLENLGVALQGEGPARPERSRLLEGFLALKRELTVELLAACCEHASKAELDRLQDACFALRDAVRWEEDHRQWAAWEFELLRRAARAADRPGHLLLIHSLERSFCGMAGRVLPHLESASICRWAECALYALGDKDAQALRRDLPPLLKTADERLLDSRGPTGKKVDPPASPLAAPPGSEASRLEALVSEEPTSEKPASEAVTSEAVISEAVTSEAVTSEAVTFEAVISEAVTSEAVTSEAVTSEAVTSAAALSAAPLSAAVTPTEPTSAVAPPCAETPAPAAATGERLAGSVLPNRSACMTGSYETRPTGAPLPESAAVRPWQPASCTALGANGFPAHEPGRVFHPPAAPTLAVGQQGASPDEMRVGAAAPAPLLWSGAAGPPDECE